MRRPKLRKVTSRARPLHRLLEMNMLHMAYGCLSCKGKEPLHLCHCPQLEFNALCLHLYSLGKNVQAGIMEDGCLLQQPVVGTGLDPCPLGWSIGPPCTPKYQHFMSHVLVMNLYNVRTCAP